MSTQETLPAPGSTTPRPLATAADGPGLPWRGLLAAVCLAVILLVFALPLVVPMKPVHGISASYLVGFNNSVAVLAAAGISVAVLLLSYRFRDRPMAAFSASPAAGGRLHWGFVGTVSALSSAVLVFAGSLVVAAHERYLGDAGYIIEQASTWTETGRRLYSQIEFAYGPLLLVPEALLSRWAHLEMIKAYLVILVLESVLGLVMVAFLLNELPIRPRLRQAALVLFALGAITPHLGLNYTFFRFASPLALFLLAAKRAASPRSAAALLSLAVVAECAISPELAIALVFGILVFAGLRTWSSGRAWLLAGAVPAAVLGLLFASVGRSYLHMVSAFQAGVLNLPVGPYPHILVFLAAMVWLVPVFLGRFLPLTDAGSARVFGLYAISLAMAPAALHRCDPLHVFFNGIGFLVLATAAVSRASHRARLAWVVAVALLVLWEHRVNEALFSWRTAYTVQRALLPRTPAPLRPAVIALAALPDRNVRDILLQPPQPQEMPDLEVLDSIIGSDPVAVPFEVPPDLEAVLKSTHHYRPLYYAFGVDMMDDNAEKRAVKELEGFRWLLLPTQLQLSDFQQTANTLGPLQGMRMYFRMRNPPAFVPGEVFEAGVAQDWTPMHTFGTTTLYRRVAVP